MTENKMILLQQIYNDSCSIFEKVNEDIYQDLNGKEDIYQDIKNIFEKIHKNPSLQQIFYDLQSLLDEVDNENEDLYQEYKNIIRKCVKNSAFRETCDDLCSLFDKLKGKEYFHQELENISTKFDKFDKINSN